MYFLSPGRMLLALAALFLALLAIASHLPSSSSVFDTSTEKWEPQGDFQQVRIEPRMVIGQPESLYWVMPATQGPPRGSLRSAPFPAPSFVSLLINGDCSQPGVEVYFESLQDGQREYVTATTEPYLWRRVIRWLPGSWLNKPVRLVAQASGRPGSTPFGISNPRAYTGLSILSAQLRTLIIVPLFLTAFLLFLVPGLVPAVALVRREIVPAPFAIMAAITVSSLLGYIAFWAYLVSPSLGWLFSLAVLFAGLSACGAAWRGKVAGHDLLGSCTLWLPIGWMILVGLFYQGLLFGADLSIPLDEQSRFRYLEHPLPEDNIIPFLFAAHLEAGTVPRLLHGDWYSSDRPPLQTGIYLVQLPIARLLGLPAGLHYQVLGAVLQGTWIAALWCMCQAIHLSRRQTTWVLLFLVFTGFLMVNTVYVWPKMLAGALIIFSATLILHQRFRGGPASVSISITAAIPAALALLAHGSAVFTLLALLLFLCTSPSLRGIRLTVTAAVALALLLLPWQWYQHAYGPPGNRLIKWHLAGVKQADSRSTWDTLAESYRRLDFAQLLQNKWQNLRVLATENPRSLYFGYPWRDVHDVLNGKLFRRREFHNLFYALGVLNVGWLTLLPALARRKSALPPPTARMIRDIFLIVLLNLVCWILMLFGPGTAVLHHSSYAMYLLLAAALAMTILPWGQYVLVTVLLCQILDFAFVWLATSPAQQFGVPNFFMLFLPVLLGGCIMRYVCLHARPSPQWV